MQQPKFQRKIAIARFLILCGLICVADPLFGYSANGGGEAKKPGLTERKQLEIGAKLPEFSLKDFRGKAWQASDFAEKKSTVVIFFGLECPLARLYAPRLNEIDSKWSKKGVQLIGVNSNKQDSITEMKHFAESTKTEFPLLKDVGNKLADQFGAERTPEVYVFNSDNKLVYRGRIDDQYTYGRQRKNVQKEYMLDAVRNCLTGVKPMIESTDSVGCHIGRILTEKGKGDVTYSNQISRILQNNCVSCHRPGEIAPFSLLEYDEVSGWAEMIQEVVNEKRMPPWHADPKHGTFMNDARLSNTDIDLLNQWVENGAPEGDPANLPEPRKFSEGWQIGTPDAIIAMSKRPFKVPATGTVPYKYFTAETNFTEDKWVNAAEVRIGNRPVVHHVIIGLKNERRGNRIHGDVSSEWIAATAPGSPPMVLPEGYAKFIPAGSTLVFQMHYTPVGTPEEDITSVGFKFIDEKDVKHQVGTKEVINTRFRIPPNAGNHPVKANYRFNQDALMISMFPHMHLRGKAFKYEVKYPDGKKEVLLDVPNYDFNWQNGYRFVEPKKMPAGSTITCTAHFDNSEKNIANPNPNSTVRWGDQTWEEMMIGYFDMTPALERGSTDARHRTKTYVETHRKKAGDVITKRLIETSKKATNDQKSMNAFAKELKAVIPQIDRVCWTTVSKSNLTVELCTQSSAFSEKKLRGAGAPMRATGYQLKKIILNKKTTHVEDHARSQHADMQYMGAAVQSSFHIPVMIKGKTGTLNFWSSEKKAFPHEATEVLEKLIENTAPRGPR